MLCTSSRCVNACPGAPPALLLFVVCSQNGTITCPLSAHRPSQTQPCPSRPTSSKTSKCYEFEQWLYLVSIYFSLLSPACWVSAAQSSCIPPSNDSQDSHPILLTCMQSFQDSPAPWVQVLQYEVWVPLWADLSFPLAFLLPLPSLSVCPLRSN